MRQPISRSLAAAAALALLALPALARGGDPFRLLPAEEVQRMLGAPDVRVYDVNIDELWQKHHLPGAIHLGARDMGAVLPADRGTRLVFYCSGPK